MSEPVAVGSLAQRAAAMAAKAASVPGLTLVVHDGDDYDDVRARSMDEARRRVWHRRMPQRFRHATLDEFGGTVAAELAAWATDPQGRNLVLLGPVGTGKTHAAVAACRAAHWAGLEVRFAALVDLLDALRPGGPEGALDDLADVDRLIVDDVGSERSTDWTTERLFALVNRRWCDERPTVYTSNLEPAALEAAVGARTFSRMVGSDAVVLVLNGTDRRRGPRPVNR